MRTQIYTVFSRAQVKIVRFMMRNSATYTIFVCAQAKFSFYTTLGLHGAFRNVTPCIDENPL